MRKETWFNQLKSALNGEGIPPEDRRAALHYYEEMYQDKLDDGMTEAEILKEFGFPEDVAQSVKEGTDVKVGRTSQANDRMDNAKSDNVFYPPQEDAVRRNDSREPFVEYREFKAPDNGNNVTQTSKQPFSLVTAIVMTMVALVCLFFGIGLAIGGVATIFGSLFVDSTAVVILIVGIGIVLFAGGCLLCAAGVSLLKYWRRAWRNAK